MIGLLSCHPLSERADGARRDGRAGRRHTLEELLRQLVDEKSYPIPHRLAWSAAIGDAPSGADQAAEFQFGVDCILDGVQKLIQRTAGRGA